mgnify:CR=1 FL=1
MRKWLPAAVLGLVLFGVGSASAAEVIVTVRPPRAIVERLNREMVAILRSPAQMERFAQQGLESMPSTPEEMTERIRNEYPAWTKVMRAAGISNGPGFTR